MRFLIIFIFLLSNSVADETINIKNLVINKELKKYDSITFLDVNNDQLDLNNYQGNNFLSCHILMYSIFHQDIQKY